MPKECGRSALDRTISGAKLSEKKIPPTSTYAKRKANTWASLSKAVKICDKGTRWPIYNGASISFWHGDWTGHGPLRKFIHGPLYANETSLKVKDTWDTQGNWNLTTLSFLLPTHVQNIIHATPKPFFSTSDDLPTWSCSPSTIQPQFSLLDCGKFPSNLNPPILVLVLENSHHP